MTQYDITVRWSNVDEAFIAEVPALPGCSARGVDAEAAVTACQDAIELWDETARESGRSLAET